MPTAFLELIRSRRFFWSAAGLVAFLTAVPLPAASQALTSTSTGAAPVDVVTRTEQGEITVHALRTATPPKVDGHLDEEIYRIADGTGAFIQNEPHEGEQASEQTDIWVYFDEENIYVSARCWDSHPERQTVSELRRDQQSVNLESIAVVLDTFHDRRNGFFFGTNAIGALRDQAIIAEAPNDDWNTVWDVKVSKFEGGWAAEMVIPFKSLRYAGSGPQVWGINFRRIVTWKNEISFLKKIPIAYGQAVSRSLGSAATLVGLETPRQSMNLEVKPYGVSSLTTDRTVSVPFDNDFDGTGGIDLKYGLTRSLIADATFNTDFAQIEEDVQQVNLTRFNLFFPEKRDFFLEGQGIFGFGGITFENRLTTPGDVPVLFFSRRIGLSEGQTVPVRAGGRVTGKAGRFTLGAINVQTGENEAAGAVDTNFSVARLKWDFLRRSNIGVLVTRRAPAGGVTNLAYGGDATVRLGDSLDIYSYYAETDTPGLDGRNNSYRGRFEFITDRYGLFAEQLMVGEHFNPEVGFVRRVDFQRQFAQGRFSPRPPRNDLIRKFTWLASIDYFTDASRTVVQDRQTRGSFQIDFQSGDNFNVEYVGDYERIPEAFAIAPDVDVPPGEYSYDTGRVSYNLGMQRRISGRVSFGAGSFYGGGKKTEASYSGRVSPVSRFAVEPSISLNWVELPYGDFNATLLTSRFIVTPTPRMILSSLVQFNALSHSLSSSVRLRWEYTPGSELFVVYSDGRDTESHGVPDVLNRTTAVKITRLVRF